LEERITSITKLEEINEVTTNVVLSSLIVSTLKMEAVVFSETSLLTKATRRYIGEDDIPYIFTLIVTSCRLDD
jgi:hypothetical protein